MMSAEIKVAIAIFIGTIIFTILFTMIQNRRKRIQQQDRDAERALEKFQQKKERNDDQNFEKIVKAISDLYKYRITGTTYRMNELELTGAIYQLSLQFKTDKYAAICTQIKEFGEDYKDKIPPGGARSTDAAELKEYRRQIEELKKAIDEFGER